MDLNKMVQGIRQGDHVAISKAISSIENQDENSEPLVEAIFNASGRSVVLGVTGSSGAGKSTLINKLALSLHREGLKLGIIAIDPTSHISGGALLGDRIRMTELIDTGIYLRSMATRGSTGAISAALRNSIRVLEYAGYDLIIVESAGAGQDEVSLSKIADLNILTLSPNSGDMIQLSKSGIMETGDIFAVTKADIDGASNTYSSLLTFLRESKTQTKPFLVSAINNTGISELTLEISKRIKLLSERKEERNRAKLAEEFNEILLSELRDRISKELLKDDAFKTHLEKVVAHEETPTKAARTVLKNIKIEHG